jgi:hypothetical protein
MAKPSLRATIRRVQLLEQDAADKAGVLFLALDEARISDARYRAAWIERLLKAITPEVLDAAQAGKDLFAEVTA